MIVLDASALLALLFSEEGADVVAPVLAESVMSTVNMAEVLGRFTRDGHDSNLVRRGLLRSPVEWVDFDTTQATLAASLLPATRAMGLSLGDRACLALALQRGRAAMTADRAWHKLRVGVEIHLIR